MNMMKFNKLLTRLGAVIFSYPLSIKEKETLKNAVVEAIMHAESEMSMLKVFFNIAVKARTNREGEDASKERILADFFNEMTQSGEVNGIETVALINKEHICDKPKD